MDVRKIAVGVVAAYIFCLGASVAVFAEEPAAGESVDVGVTDTGSDTPVDVGEEEILESTENNIPSDTPIEDGGAQDGEQTDTVTEYIIEEPLDVVVIETVEPYTVWDKPFNEYQPTEAFTFLLVVFAMLAGMVKFISWAWL